MIINLKQLKFYYLTIPQNKARIENIKNQFSEFNITQVIPVMHNVSKFQSGASGFSRMIDLGLRKQKRNKPFQPFVLLEDDASKYRDFPDQIEIPDKADILYIGVSEAGMNNKTNKNTNPMVYTETVDGFPNIMKVYNMLTTHGLIICSALGATICQKAMSDAFYKNCHYDQPLALLHPYYNIYALKEPLVYQDGRLDGDEAPTKKPLTLQFADKPMPSFLKNTTNFSVITSSKKIK